MGGSTKLMSSGAGGVILTTPGSIAADVTVNLPTQNSTLAINGPAFSAYQSTAQTALSANTWTKLAFQSEEFDTNSNFDTSTYRFTPNVAGYYQVTGFMTASTSFTYGQVFVYKNGSQFKLGNSNGYSANTSNAWGASCLVYMNGTTDYLELYGLMGLSQAPAAGAGLTFFQGVLVRSA